MSGTSRTGAPRHRMTAGPKHSPCSPKLHSGVARRLSRAVGERDEAALPEAGRAGTTPLYVRPANVLRDRIRSGRIPVGRRLPSQAEPEVETGGVVSRRTIKTALEVLANEGLVQGVQGKGVFVIALPSA